MSDRLDSELSMQDAIWILVQDEVKDNIHCIMHWKKIYFGTVMALVHYGLAMVINYVQIEVIISLLMTVNDAQKMIGIQVTDPILCPMKEMPK